MTGFQTIGVLVLIGVLTFVIVVISIILIVGLFLDNNKTYTNTTMIEMPPTTIMHYED